MKFYTTLPKSLKPYFDAELNKYTTAIQQNNFQQAWKHLERAHIIGQRYPMAHSFVHWKMLLFGIKIKSIKEVLGQIPRLLIGGVKSFVGHVPVGNPGGSNVPPLKSYPVESDIQQIFQSTGINY